MNLYRCGNGLSEAVSAAHLVRCSTGSNLTQEQRTQVSGIFDDARKQLTELRKESEPKFREVRKNTDERLRSVLTPEAVGAIQQMNGEKKPRLRPSEKRWSSVSVVRSPCPWSVVRRSSRFSNLFYFPFSIFHLSFVISR